MAVTITSSKRGIGEVYKARDTKLDREMAIKVLSAALARDRQRDWIDRGSLRVKTNVVSGNN